MSDNINTNNNNQSSNNNNNNDNGLNNNSMEKPLFVIIRLPIKRPDNFVEPPCTLWNETKEQLLWEYLNNNKGRNIDWDYLSKELQIPTPYLIKFASFLYEVQLLKLRNQWNPTIDNINIPIEANNNNTQIDQNLPVSDNKEGDRINNEEEEREVLSNINQLQTKLLEEPYLNTDTQRSTPFVTPLSSPMNRSGEFYSPNTLSKSSPLAGVSDLGNQLSEQLAKVKLNSDTNTSGLELEGNTAADFRFNQSQPDLNTNTSSRLDESNEEENENNSIGSPYSDLSDESVTQSQLEDAFLSKFNK